MKDKEWYGKHLAKKLDEYKVDVPNFPLKRSRSERIAELLFSPIMNPLEKMSLRVKSVILLQLSPIAIIFLISLGWLAFL